MPHLLVAITTHGYGHVAHTAPVVNALRRQLPTLRLTLYTNLPRSFLAGCFDGEFAHIAQSPDVGMCMKDALEVDGTASAHAYQQYHQHWKTDVSAEARLLATHAPDAVLANVPYRILAAAARANIPALAMCNLNWTDIYRYFCASQPGSSRILDTIQSAYDSARVFLQPTPHMPMADLNNGVSIGPIARIGNDLRTDLRRHLGIPATGKLVLVSLGGVPTQLSMAGWPMVPDVFWIVPAAYRVQRRDTFELESLNMNFIDILRSVDALITKPGYGSFVEAACNGVPILYAPRIDWPEEPYLVNWLQRHGVCLPIQRTQLQHGELANALEQLFALPKQEALIPSGINEAVTHISAHL